MREIVTIQVGDFANYIGSHFWNFQDGLLGLAEDQHGDSIYKNLSLNMDVLYRSGETQQVVKTKVLTCFCSPMPSSNATALQSVEAVLVEMAWTKVPMAARLRSTRAVMPEKAGAASQVWNAERSSGCWIAPKLGLRARRNRRHGRNLGQDGHATRSSFSNVHNFGKMWNSSF